MRRLLLSILLAGSAFAQVPTVPDSTEFKNTTTVVNAALTWLDSNKATTSLVSALPSSCTFNPSGPYFFYLRTTDFTLHACTATNTITQIAGGGSGGGTGSVTSVAIQGTANQITVSGVCTGTSTISCTLALPSGVILPGTINKLTLTQPATGSTITVADGKTITVNKSLTLDGTDGVTVTFPTTSATVATIGLTNTFTGRQDATGAASTAPMKTGTSLPLTCAVGDLFFKSNATAGQNIYLCSVVNTWTQQLNTGASGVPYTGATADVDLALHNLNANQLSTGDITGGGYTRIYGATSGSIKQTAAASGSDYTVTWPGALPIGGVSNQGFLIDPSGTITFSGPLVTNLSSVLADGQLVCGNGGSDLAPCDLSGDVTTTGSGVATVVRVNGVAYTQAPLIPNTIPLQATVGNVTYGKLTPLYISSVSGNGAAVVTTTGTQTTGRLVEIDANGNHIASARTNVAPSYQTVQWGNVDVPQQPIINFVSGSNVSLAATNDPANLRTTVTISATGGGSGGGAVNFTPQLLSLTIPPPVFGVATTAPATVANTTTATSLLGSFRGSSTVCAGCAAVGQTVTIKAAGSFGAVSNPTLALTVKLAAVTVATLSPSLTSITGSTWDLEYRLTVQSLTTATGSGCVTITTSAGAVTKACSSGQTTGLNFAASQALDLTSTWGTANSSNTITGNVLVASLN